MDTKQLISDAKARFAHLSAREYLRDKYTSRLTVAALDGLWVASPELISFLTTSTQDNVVLIDNFGNPVRVARGALCQILRDTYTKVMDDWYDELTTLENLR